MPNPELPLDQILHGDCNKILPKIPDKSIDLVFADPPYNLQLGKELYRPNLTRVYAVEESWDRFSNFEAYDQFCKEWLSECRRILSDTGTIWVIGTYHNIFRVGQIMQDLGFWILNDIVWIKNNPMPNFHGVRFTNAHETLIWAQKIKGSRYTFNYQTMKALNTEANQPGIQMRSDWKLPICTGKERIKVNGGKAHPTQKPEALLERVILSSTNPGDIILDPFFGTGTTGAVAKRLCRHWIGVEAESAYIEMAQTRIDSILPDSNIDQFRVHNRDRKLKRIPFIALLDRGFLRTGQELWLDEHRAEILPNGNVRCGQITGSIHKVGSELRKAPCNGWMAWYYINLETGHREPIDVLRQKARRQILLEMVPKQDNEL